MNDSDSETEGVGTFSADTCSAETRLTNAGVFKGAHGLRGLLECREFWDSQPYGTRLYYGDGIADYLHRDVLRAAVRILDGQNASAQLPPRSGSTSTKDVIGG